jgi:hypothetical protein
MGRWLAMLGTPNVHGGRAIKLDLRPFQVAQLDGAKPMPIGNKDQSRVTVPIAAFAGGPGKLFRYSRGRKSRLLGRVGIGRAMRTDRFSLLGRTNCRCAVIGLFPRGLPRLTGQRSFSSHFSSELA